MCTLLGMLSIKKVLVPVDFTETSDKEALDVALELAEKVDATVLAMHAYEIPVIGFPDGALVATADIASKLQEAASQVASTPPWPHARRAGDLIASVLREGNAWEEIKAVAEEMHVDIIVDRHAWPARHRARALGQRGRRTSFAPRRSRSSRFTALATESLDT